MIDATLHGPVVIVEPGRKTPLLAYKLIFPDRCEIVVAAPTRPLWFGSDGQAFDVARTQAWRIMATLRDGVIRL